MGSSYVGAATAAETKRFQPCLTTQIVLIDADWAGWSCESDANHAAAIASSSTSMTASVIAGRGSGPMPHHPIFHQFTPWQGSLRHNKLLVDFLNFTVPEVRYCNPAYMYQVRTQAIRTRQCHLRQALLSAHRGVEVRVQTRWPVVAEEYVEYVDVLSSVSEYLAEVNRATNLAAASGSASGVRGRRVRPFTFIELGCGYGHWTMAAHAALRQKLPAGFDHRYLLVDVLDTLSMPIHNLASLNKVDPSSLAFHVGFVVGAGQTLPHNGRAEAISQANAYSRLWGKGLGKSSRTEQLASKPADLRQLLDQYEMPRCIDMLDCDVQHAEYALFDNVTVRLLTQRVRRVHIGLHGVWSRNDELVRMFRLHGWNATHVYYPVAEHRTPYGRIDVGDGIASFTNPALLSCHDL